MPADRAGRASPLRALMAAVLLLTIIGISGATDREAGGASFANTQAKLVASANDPGVGPVAGWLDDVIKLLEDLIRALEDAEEEAQINATSGSRGQGLPNPADLLPDWLAIYLDLAEADIDQILDGNQYPSLTPVDAGHVILAEIPMTLSELASRCVGLAQQAFDEMIGPADHEVVGTKLKTIKALLPEYRTLAGIE